MGLNIAKQILRNIVSVFTFFIQIFLNIAKNKIKQVL